MPIIDVELVCATEAHFREVSASAVAEAIGRALHKEAGHVWVKLRFLSGSCYAENGASLSDAELPAFVTIQHATVLEGEALVAEAKLLTEVVAKAIGRPCDRVHVEYSPAGAGRQAFGGRLVQRGT